MSDETDKKDQAASSTSSTATKTKPATKRAASKPAAKREAKPAATTPPVTEDHAGKPDAAPEQVEQDRKDQLKAGDKALSSKAQKAATAMANATPNEQRAGRLGAKLSEGRVDNMSRRDDSDVLMNHFCLIDYGNKEFGDEARQAAEAIVGEGNARLGAADYGVFIAAGTLDEDGYPLTATVMLRDEHGGAQVTVPYGALVPAQAGRR